MFYKNKYFYLAFVLSYQKINQLRSRRPYSQATTACPHLKGQWAEQECKRNMCNFCTCSCGDPIKSHLSTWYSFQVVRKSISTVPGVFCLVGWGFSIHQLLRDKTPPNEAICWLLMMTHNAWGQDTGDWVVHDLTTLEVMWPVTLHFTGLDRCLVRSNPINQLIMSSPSTYMIVTTVFFKLKVLEVSS